MQTKHTILNVTVLVSLAASMLVGGSVKVTSQTAPAPAAKSQAAQTGGPVNPADTGTGQMRTTTNAMRQAAAAHMSIPQKGAAVNFAGLNADLKGMSPMAGNSAAPLAAMAAPLSPPDYFGVANWANSPLPTLTAGVVNPGSGMRKFVDTLPGLCQVSGVNDLGQCIPLGVADTTTFPGSDYYEIAVVQYREQMHRDLPGQCAEDATGKLVCAASANGLGTELRGYVQIVPSNFVDPISKTTAVALTTANGLTQNITDRNGVQLYGAYKPHYLGPIILAHGCDPNAASPCTPTPVRVKFDNYLPTGPGGDLFIPTDTTYMGAGEGPMCANGKPAAVNDTCVLADYTQNRATLHLHGGATPWISDGTPHQWTAPAGEATFYTKGASAAYVPDMWFTAAGALIPSCAGSTTCAVAGASNDPGLGSLTFYWTNQQSGRLMFYHDHAYGITRLNVYAGEAAGYLLVDKGVEDALAAAGVPGTLGAANDVAHVVPLVIQDRTFVPDNGLAGGQLALTDPTWSIAQYGGKGNLWFPHVYTPNQNPADITGANPFGRWDYGPWFWPPQDPSTYVPGGQPYTCTSAAYSAANPPAFPPVVCPGTPNPSGTPEGFMDTPVINGTAYPSLTVDPTAYRFQILNAANDRTLDLGLYVAEPLTVAVTNGGSGYTLPPIVGFTGGGGAGAAGTAVMSNGGVTTILITGTGHGYTVAPNVTITGNGTGASAVAVVDPITTTVLNIRITSPGSGYTSATVTIDPPVGCTTGCVTATASATVTPPGTILGVTVTNPGSGYTSAPTITFTNAPGDTTGAGAVAIASINTEVKMVDATPHTMASPLPLCNQANATSGAQLALALTDASGNPINGTGLPLGCWPTTWPTDGRDGGVPDPASAGPAIVQIGTEGGTLPAPVIIPSTPTGYEYNRRSITVLNIFTHGLLMGPAERTDIVVDFSKFAGKTLIVYNDSPAPVPAFDSRMDYYTGDPDQTSTGGAPTTLPGYGPNTRTIMQIKVNAALGAGAALSSVTVTNGGTGYTAPSVAFTPVLTTPPNPTTPASATATGSVTGLTLTAAGTGYSNPVVTFSGGGGSGASAAMASGVVSGLSLTAGGTGYATMPTVGFTGGGGTLAAANATGGVNAIAVNGGGAGYASLPTISFTGGSGTGAAASATGAVDGVAVTNGGGGYATMPTVTFTGGAGTSAAATATGAVDALNLATPGAGYTTPAVSIPGGATATLTGSVDSLTLGTPGAGYTAPVVTFTGGGGTGAAAGVTGLIDGITVTNIGTTAYTAPVITITDPNPAAAGATATANLDVNGFIASITINTPGSGYTAPVVAIADSGVGTGTGATASATIAVTAIALTSGGTGYTSAPSVSISGGTGAVATATISVTSITLGAAGSGYASAPVVTISNTGPAVTTPASATATLKVNAVAITAGGTGYTSVPTVGFSAGTAAATATLAVNAVTVTAGGAGYTSAPVVVFSSGAAAATATLTVTALNLTSPGTGYTSAPTVTFTGGGGTGAAATAAIASTGLRLISGGSGYTSAPTVAISDTAPGTGSGATATATLSITSITLTNPGAGYTAVPGVTITDTGLVPGTGATAVANMVSGAGFVMAPLNAALPNIFAAHEEKIIVPETAYPASNGGSANSNYLRIQDTNLKSWVGGPVGALTLLNGGLNYASAPTVSLVGGGGTGATATASFAGATVNSITLTAKGLGYTSAPTVTIANGGGTGATATAVLTRIVNTVNVTNGGFGYLVAPTVTLSGGGGAGALATASITGMLNTVTMLTRGSGYSAATTTVAFTGGGGSGAAGTANIGGGGRINSITITNRGTGYTSAPTVTITGAGTGATATATFTQGVSSITVTASGTGYATPPAVTFAGGGGVGATATAVLTGIVNSVLITNGGSGYTSNPTVSFAGGGGTGAAATATYLPGTVTGLTLTNGGTGFTAAPTVTFTGGGTPTTPASAVATAPTTQLLPKAIQELFTLDYGRMNATLGVELPFTNFLTQTTIPMGYVDPPTELFKDGEMQIWKITHNGVDTHFIHFHLFSVQVINRVGWDGAIKPPDANELAWKDTVRMNPLEDIIVALRPIKQNLPWQLPNSIRPMDVTKPIGYQSTMSFTNVDPTNQPATVTNSMVNFGYEYVWHCHILGHEENDMMRAMVFAVPPLAPSTLTVSTQLNTRTLTLRWTDNSLNETGFTVQRSSDNGATWVSIATVPGVAGLGSTLTYRDTTVARRTSYSYRVIANNLVGYTQTYAAPAVGYPSMSADSGPSNVVSVTTNNSIFAFIFANNIQANLAGWAGLVGNVQAVPQAALGPNGGALGMAAILGAAAPAQASATNAPDAAYVYDLTPNGVSSYDASFYFSPNGSNSGDEAVDIFSALDQNSQPAFGIQYQNADAGRYEVRAWALLNGAPVYTDWTSISNAAHKLELAWISGSNAGISLYVDDFLTATLSGSTGAHQVYEVLLGASGGMTPSTSGTLYFDEFTSSQINGITFNSFVPVIKH